MDTKLIYEKKSGDIETKEDEEKNRVPQYAVATECGKYSMRFSRSEKIRRNSVSERVIIKG